MAGTIDEATVIAWVDGELTADEAKRVSAAIATDPGLAALAEAHQAMKARFAAAFNPIAEEPVSLPLPSPAVSLAAARAARQAKASMPPWRRWAIPGAMAASLVVGVLIGYGPFRPTGVNDRTDALALSMPIAQALDGRLSGEKGAVRVALSFRDHRGQYCRSFAATHLAGIACRNADGWQLRYAAPATKKEGDYRMAGGDTELGEVITTMISGDPLDAAGEQKARADNWR
jgi:hypothetical protein